MIRGEAGWLGGRKIAPGGGRSAAKPAGARGSDSAGQAKRSAREARGGAEQMFARPAATTTAHAPGKSRATAEKRG